MGHCTACYHAAKLSRRKNNINKRCLHTLKGLTLFLATLWSLSSAAIEIETPPVGLTGVPVEIAVTGADAGTSVALSVADSQYLAIADAEGRSEFADIVLEATGVIAISASVTGASTAAELRILPGWISLLPAFLAIGVALLIRNVVPALVLGLWFGSVALRDFSVAGTGTGLLDVFAVYIKNALNDTDRVAIILFTMMIGGMVGIITRNGGMASIVRVVVSKAKTAIGGQVAAWLMGLMIFFDDYANTLVVGNTARPITDQLKISREKLAYIVDSTAAPVVSIALITTWIGYEVSLIDEALQGIGELADVPAYAIFLQSIPYSFYPILAIVFVLMVAVTGRDMGPMYTAEVRARRGKVVAEEDEADDAVSGDTLEPKPEVPLRAFNAFVPIIVLVTALLGGLYATGEGDSVREVIGDADPYKAMMWASFIGALTAAVMSIGQRILTTHETVDAWYGGARATLFGMIVLVLAWSMSDVTTALNAKGYLITILGESMPAAWVPAAVFVLAGVTAFATGTSWGTMGILVPLVVPLAWAVMSVNGMTDAGDMHILYSSVSCVLAGAVWGDHCSPISDTTVLSSIASGCNHIEHVRTQLPYALLVGLVAIVIGTVPGGYGVPPWVSLLVGGVILYLVLRLRGRQADVDAAG